MESIFYVYEHLTGDGEVFYVGKGSKDRAWSTDGRSKFWNRVYKKHGRTVRIAKDHMTEAEAFALEIELIAFHGRRDEGTGTLVNLTPGGEGKTGITEKGRWNKILKDEGLDVLYIGKDHSDATHYAKYHLGEDVFPAQSVESAYETGLVGDEMWETLNLAHFATQTEARVEDRRRASILGLNDHGKKRSLRPPRQHRELPRDWRERCLRSIIEA